MGRKRNIKKEGIRWKSLNAEWKLKNQLRVRRKSNRWNKVKHGKDNNIKEVEWLWVFI